ncbi:unnamed protein product [Amoebophrya sp. A120]|nr:unnamed protein product [Amoebophrya sp. A120]|eukprot:GSA120T00019030001.1
MRRFWCFSVAVATRGLLEENSDEDRFAPFHDVFVGTELGIDDLVVAGSVSERRATDTSTGLLQSAGRNAAKDDSSRDDVSAGEHTATTSAYQAALERGVDWRPTTIVPAAEFRKQIHIQTDRWVTTGAAESEAPTSTVRLTKLSVHTSADQVAFAEFHQTSANLLQGGTSAASAKSLSSSLVTGELLFTCRRSGQAKITLRFELERPRNAAAGTIELASDPHRSIVDVNFEKHCLGFPLIGLSVLQDGTPESSQKLFDSSKDELSTASAEAESVRRHLEAARFAASGARSAAEGEDSRKSATAGASFAQDPGNEDIKSQEQDDSNSYPFLVQEGVARGLVDASNFFSSVHKLGDLVGNAATPVLYFSEKSSSSSTSASSHAETAPHISPAGGSDNFHSAGNRGTGAAADTSTTAAGAVPALLADSPVWVFDSALVVPLALTAPSEVVFSPVEIEVQGSLSSRLSHYLGSLASGGSILDQRPASTSDEVQDSTAMLWAKSKSVPSRRAMQKLLHQTATANRRGEEVALSMPEVAANSSDGVSTGDTTTSSVTAEESSRGNRDYISSGEQALATVPNSPASSNTASTAQLNDDGLESPELPDSIRFSTSTSFKPSAEAAAAPDVVEESDLLTTRAGAVSFLQTRSLDSSSSTLFGAGALILKCDSYGPGLVRVTFSAFPAYQPYAPVRFERAIFCGHEKQRPDYVLAQVLSGDHDVVISRAQEQAAENVDIIRENLLGTSSPAFFRPAVLQDRYSFLAANQHAVLPEMKALAMLSENLPARPGGATTTLREEVSMPLALLEGEREVSAPADLAWDEDRSVFRILRADAADEYQVQCATAGVHGSQTSKALLPTRTSFKFRAGETEMTDKSTRSTQAPTVSNRNVEAGIKRDSSSQRSRYSEVTVDYQCARSGLFQCTLKPRWASVKEQYRGDGLRWNKQCGGARGITVISRDATMFGPLSLLAAVRSNSKDESQTDESGRSTATGESGSSSFFPTSTSDKLLLLPAEANLATFVLHAEKPVLLRGPPRVRVLSNGASPTSSEEQKATNDLLRVQLVRGDDITSIDRDTLLTAQFQCTVPDAAAAEEGVSDRQGSEEISSKGANADGDLDVEIALPIEKPLPEDADTLSFRIKKRCADAAGTGSFFSRRFAAGGNRNSGSSTATSHGKESRGAAPSGLALLLLRMQSGIAKLAAPSHDSYFGRVLGAILPSSSGGALVLPIAASLMVLALLFSCIGATALGGSGGFWRRIIFMKKDRADASSAGESLVGHAADATTSTKTSKAASTRSKKRGSQRS